MLKEFKAFALRGNVIDLAVAVIIGIAFNTVVQSLTDDVIMNLIAGLFGQPDFSSFTVTVGDGVILYGTFLTTIVNFVIVASVLYVLVRALNRILRPRGAPDEPPTMRECPYCTTSIAVRATRCSACTSDVETA